jgi:molybdenum cofactor biosynthesis enzyme MoaA
MKIKTFSIVAGSEACNARCPFCVSKMTPLQGIDSKKPAINIKNFHVAARLAQINDVDTAMITSKGEATLFPDQITTYIDELQQYKFLFVELQTNGILLDQNREKYDSYVKEWYRKGLTTVALSVVHFDAEKNRQNYLPHKSEYMDLSGLVDYLHDVGLSVRLGCVMIKDGIDSVDKMKELYAFAKKNNIEQLTLRPVNKPAKSRNDDVYNWTMENYVPQKNLDEITEYLDTHGTKLLELPHGGTVYDIEGQNICMTNSLTRNKDTENMRQIIFFPDGHIRYDWEYTGAVMI